MKVKATPPLRGINQDRFALIRNGSADLAFETNL